MVGWHGMALCCRSCNGRGAQRGRRAKWGSRQRRLPHGGQPECWRQQVRGNRTAKGLCGLPQLEIADKPRQLGQPLGWRQRPGGSRARQQAVVAAEEMAGIAQQLSCGCMQQQHAAGGSYQRLGFFGNPAASWRWAAGGPFSACQAAYACIAADLPVPAGQLAAAHALLLLLTLRLLWPRHAAG